MGLSLNAKKGDIKKQYRKMANLYHPDRVAQKSKIEIEQATKAMQELNAAYEYLMK